MFLLWFQANPFRRLDRGDRGKSAQGRRPATLQRWRGHVPDLLGIERRHIAKQKPALTGCNRLAVIKKFIPVKG